MKGRSILILGGTGIIGEDLVRSIVVGGDSPVVLSRQGRPPKNAALSTAEYIAADAYDDESIVGSLGNRSFDAIVDLLSFTPRQLERMAHLLGTRAEQYLFISSATVSAGAAPGEAIRETDALISKGHWSYPERKIACEVLFHELAENIGFEATVVRPYITYSPQRIAFGIWESEQVLARLRDRRPVIIGDEVAHTVTSLTHSSDLSRGVFALIGNRNAFGETFQIASPEETTWGEVYEIAAAVLNVPLEVVPVPTDMIGINFPELRGKIADRLLPRRFASDKLLQAVPDFSFNWDVKQGYASAIEALLAAGMVSPPARVDGGIDRLALSQVTFSPQRIAIHRYSRSLIWSHPREWMHYFIGRCSLLSKAFYAAKALRDLVFRRG